MQKEEFLNQVDQNAQQVFVMQTRVCFPLSLFVHTYIVTNDCGTLTRWDVWHKKGIGGKSVGHVHRASAAPWKGISMMYFGNLFSRFLHFQSSVIHVIKGAEARSIITFFDIEGFTYPHRDRYHLYGPNSNTYVAWVLDHFVDSQQILSWNAVGKNYKK